MKKLTWRYIDNCEYRCYLVGICEECPHAIFEIFRLKCGKWGWRCNDTGGVEHNKNLAKNAVEKCWELWNFQFLK